MSESKSKKLKRHATSVRSNDFLKFSFRFVFVARVENASRTHRNGVETFSWREVNERRTISQASGQASKVEGVDATADVPQRRLFHFFFSLHFSLLGFLRPWLRLFRLRSSTPSSIISAFLHLSFLRAILFHLRSILFHRLQNTRAIITCTNEFQAISGLAVGGFSRRWIRWMGKNKYDNTLRVWYRTILVDNLIQQIPTKSFPKGSQFLPCSPSILRFLLRFILLGGLISFFFFAKNKKHEYFVKPLSLFAFVSPFRKV